MVRLGKRKCGTVYPACAGIDFEDVIDGGGGERLPRMRGDRPYWIFANR